MSFDFSSLGITTEQKAEKAEKEQEAPQQEQTAPAPKEEPKKPKVDRSVPLEERIAEEEQKLRFAAGVMGDYRRAASSTFCHHLLDVLADPKEEQRAKAIREKFDENEWTFEELFDALAQRFQKELGNNYCVIGGDMVLGWATEIITNSKPKDHKQKPITPPKPTTPKPETAKPKEEKQEPKEKKPEQLSLNFDALFD